MNENRPYLRPELPPDWWIQERRWEQEQKEKEENENLDSERRVVIIDI
tara:strand:+ start:354 stop:497 length:144 start_codon:yes stop_codon:yes gene_type:complete